MAEALAEAGANLVVAARSEGPLKELAAKLESLGVRAIPFPLDVTNRADLERLVKTCVDEFGSLDVLINNAGVNHRCPAEDFSLEQWDLVWEFSSAYRRRARHPVEETPGGAGVSPAI